MNWLHYLLEANLYLVAFYALYYIIFSRETHYQLNRIYLLGSSALAFVIPLIQVGILNPPVTKIQKFMVIPANLQISGSQTGVVAHGTAWPAINYLLLVYGIVLLVLLINFLAKIYRLIRLSYTHKADLHTDYKLVELPDEDNAFSFFNYLFVSPALKLSSTIIHHELIHIRQKHSWDIVYLELLKIINWFNPVSYLLQNSIKEVHEFIADSQTLNSQSNASVYTDFLINNAYGISENTLINTFFNKSLLKKRIMMLHQKRSGKAARLKYLLALPLITGLLCASTLGFSKSYALIDLAPRHAIVINKTPGKVPADTLKYRSKSKAVTSKGYKFEETAYLINNKTNYRVIITEKNGDRKQYYKNAATTAQLAMLKDKYGYTFPSMQIFNRLPPPPPMNPKAVGPPPPPPANPKEQGPPPVPPVKRDSSRGVVRFPPPSVWSSSLAELREHMLKNVHYPADARSNRVTGNVIAGFKINNDHKITDVKIINGIGNGCDDEILRALKSYNGPLSMGAGDYVFATSFYIINENGKDQYAAKPIDEGLFSKSNFLGDLAVATYIK